MDVDLLRPGTVPISKDTTMWFEFLLDPDILDKHLQKPKPDPSPTELIAKFLTISADINLGKDVVILEPEVEPEEEKLVPSRRSKGLKILALKTAATLNWDLDTLESKLPFFTQWMLLQDLLSAVHQDTVVSDLQSSPDHVLFALSLYHRWALRSLYNSALLSKLRTGAGPDVQDERFLRLEQEAELSMHSLADMCERPLGSHVTVPSPATFIPLTEHSEHERPPAWERGLRISSAQFVTMILMDLGTYLFFREEYGAALGHFERCRRELDRWGGGTGEPRLSTVDPAAVDGYITACQRPALSPRLSLTDRFLISVSQHYEQILTILVEDNARREVPMSMRESLELDLAAAISSGGFTAARDLVFQIQSLNTVYRRALDLPSLYNYGARLSVARRGVEILIWALKATVSESRPEEKLRLGLFLLELVEGAEGATRLELTSHNIVRELLRTCDSTLSTNADSQKPPELAPYVSPDFNNIQLRNGELENQLMSSYEPMVIKDTIIKLIENNAIRPVWQIESKWELGIPLHGVVYGISSSLLQHYIYVLLGKAKLMDSLGRHEVARRLLMTAEAEVNHHGGMMKLSQLISWESFLVECHSLLAEWPDRNAGGKALVGRCLGVLQTTEGPVVPRVEVVETAAITLLNLGEWEALITFASDKRLVLCELSGALAHACLDLCKFKGNKKLSRAAWDLIVPVFGSPGGVGKRGGGGGSMESPLLHAVARLFSQLREATVLSAAVSLIARLINVLRDEPTLELIYEHTALWPGVVSNTNSYNAQVVGEYLLMLVNLALQYYPDNTGLHKLLGDYYYVAGQHSAAMKQYLLAAVVATDSFTRPLTKAVLEDCTYKRMIKCLSQLNCHTQAGVLCQFLEEVDYTQAFKSLSESSCSDCMDTYYDCVWDVNVLEFLICLQNKRGNRDRAKKAIDTIGLLELNNNNNDEIKREAANKRKVRFMQALVRQYVL